LSLAAIGNLRMGDDATQAR